MEFSVKKFDLLEELELTQGVVERKTTIPILSNLVVRGEGQSAGDYGDRSGAEYSHVVRSQGEKRGRRHDPRQETSRSRASLAGRRDPVQAARKSLGAGHVRSQEATSLVGMSKDNFPALPNFPHALVKIPAKLLAECHRQDHVCHLSRRISLHAERRAARPEARFGHHGRHRRPPPRHGRDGPQIRGPFSRDARARPQEGHDAKCSASPPSPAMTLSSSSRRTKAISSSSSAAAC